MKDHTDYKPKSAKCIHSGKHGGFRKKQQVKESEPNTTGEFFKGVAFSVGPHRPEWYLKK